MHAQQGVRESHPQWWFFALLALNVAWVTDLFILGGGVGNVSAPGSLPIALARLTGLYGALALVVQLLLISRMPWLERQLGLDRLTLWHRWTGFVVLWLLVAHVTFITLGYAAQDASPLMTELGYLLFDTQDVLKATVALALLVVVAVTSARAARRRLRYATWHFVHLYAYLAVVLGFLHQVTIGRDFVNSRVGTTYWWSLYGMALTAMLVWRFLVPARRALRHRLRVVDVVPENSNVVSVYMGGRHLDELPARAGQFFLWRFLARGYWHEAHPYSLSAMPAGRMLRITVKALGDGSAALRHIRLGTRVLAEGPYGAFTVKKCRRPGVLLIGGGVGVTPVRALFEELIQSGRGNVVVVYRVNDIEDAVLARELQQLAHASGSRLYVVIGPPNGTGPLGPIMGPRHLKNMVPDVRHRDVFLCGPPAMTKAITHTLRRVGVPAAQCHIERFAFAA